MFMVLFVNFELICADSLTPIDSGHSSGSGSCLSSGPLTSISSLNVEKCSDVHVGPKITQNNNNYNQIIDVDSNWVTRLADKLIDPSKTGQWRSYRRLIVGLLIVLSALLISLIVVEVMRMRMEFNPPEPKPVAPSTLRPSTTSQEPKPPISSTTATKTTTTTTTPPPSTANPRPTVAIVARQTWGGNIQAYFSS